MRDDEVARVQKTFRAIQQDSTGFASLFYKYLFAGDPSSEVLFRDINMPLQQRKLMATLEVIVANLYDLPKITQAIMELGARHTSYGVTKSHYDRAGDALLRAIEDTLAADFDLETRRSWQNAYDLVSFIMRSSSRI